MPEFRVVTHRNWIAEHFRSVGGVQDFGFDIDKDAVTDTVWWAPGEWVSRAADSGVTIPVLSCGQKWMSSAAATPFRRRCVLVVPASEVSVAFTQLGVKYAHVKLPEIKTDDFPAESRTVRDVLLSVDSGIIRPSQLVQVSENVRFTDEARFFITHGEVTAWSYYRVGDYWWTDDEFDSEKASAQDTNMIMSLAQRVAKSKGTPPGFVADIGVMKWGGQHHAELIEMNASWSSNPYDADAGGVLASITAAHDFERKYPRFRFNTEQYGKVPPLRVR